MKHIYVGFENKEHQQLKKAKGKKQSWHDFIMTLTKEVKDK
jgi:hypothetical protein